MRRSLFWILCVTMYSSSLAGTYHDLAMNFIKEQMPCEDSFACAMTTADFCDSAGKRYALLTNWVKKVEQWRYDEIMKSAPSYFAAASVLPPHEGMRQVAEMHVAIDAANLRNWAVSVGEAVTHASGGSSGLWTGCDAMNEVLKSGIAEWLGLTECPSLSQIDNMHAHAIKRLTEKLYAISCSDEVHWFSVNLLSSGISISNGAMSVQCVLTPKFPQYRRAVGLIEDALSDIAISNGTRVVRFEEYLTPYELERELDKAYKMECERICKLPRNGPRFLLKSSMKKDLRYTKARIHEFKVSESDFAEICRWCEMAKGERAHIVGLDFVDEDIDPSEGSNRVMTRLKTLPAASGGRIIPLSLVDGVLVFGLPHGPRGKGYGNCVDYDNSVVLPCRFDVDDVDFGRYKLNSVTL